MKTSRTTMWPALTILIICAIVVIDLPAHYKPWAPPIIRNLSLHLGLDLAGGTQLDFRISEDELNEQIAYIEEEIETLESQGAPGSRLTQLRTQKQVLLTQKQNLTEAIRSVLERRINALGVSEASITPSSIGGERHLLVECPGIINTQACIETVGKTIQLEFKEEFIEPTEEYETELREKVDTAYARINAGETLTVIGEDLGDELGVNFTENRPFFQNQIPHALQPLWTEKPGSGVKIFEGSIFSLYQNADGTSEQQEVPGIFLAEVTQEKAFTGRTVLNVVDAFTILKETNDDIDIASFEKVEIVDDQSLANALKGLTPGDILPTSEGSIARIYHLRQFIEGSVSMDASHILVAYNGATLANESITRSLEEARSTAIALREEILSGNRSFEEIAQQESDGPSGEDGGSLGIFQTGDMVPEFEAAAFALLEGELSHPVETPFGFHIIRADSEPSKTPDRFSYDVFTVEGQNAQKRSTDLLSSIDTGEVKKQEEAAHLRFLFFSLLPSGWKDTPLTGQHFKAATVTLDPVTNIPVVQIQFDARGGEIFQELTKRNIDKRIAIFVGGELISAPVVQQEIIGGTAVITGSRSFDDARRLAQDLNTGAIPAPIHLSGQRTVEATLGAEALKTSLEAALLGSIILMLYMILAYRLFGLVANIALTCYALIFYAFLKIPLFLFSSQYVVLTLAGMAGIILSIGMAVDANVLIFERIKEELRKGKLLETSVETGFKRAWLSIRDSNVSTILTCSILFLIGTSIVKGFAITLGMGVLISLFSAVVMTRWLLRTIAKSGLQDAYVLFGVKRSQD